MRRVIATLVSVGSIALLGACSSPRAAIPSVEASASTTHSTTGSTGAPAVGDVLPGGERLLEGAQVVSAVRYQGGEVAAGADFPAGGKPVLPICALRGCNPVVWTSSNESRWTVAWANIANGSIDGEQLVVGSNNLLLFLTDETTSLWSTTDAKTWTPVTLPEAMALLLVRKAVWAHGRFVAILSNKYAGGPVDTYGQSDTVWSSTDGTAWIQASVSGPPAVFQSLTVDSMGFQIMGILRQSQTPAEWASSDGVHWTATD